MAIAPLIQEGSKLTGGEESGAGRLGFSVALSADGNTALIGGYNNNDGVGAVWVFTRSGTTWTPQGPVLTGGKESGEGEFGRSVALSADGNTALIGGPGDNNSVGAVWVFTRSGATWTQQGEKLTGGGESGEGAFGRSVALSADGNTALIGGPGDNNSVGAVWVFTRSGATWT
ncbi:MAG: PKD domain-containing protein, partial [Solirubrobacteraceae bacterium]